MPHVKVTGPLGDHPRPPTVNGPPGEPPGVRPRPSMAMDATFGVTTVNHVSPYGATAVRLYEAAYTVYVFALTPVLGTVAVYMAKLPAPVVLVSPTSVRSEPNQRPTCGYFVP